VQVDHLATLSVPDHRVVAKGTLRSLIRAADVTVGEVERGVGAEDQLVVAASLERPQDLSMIPGPPRCAN
jgi:hypothetical protein